MLPSPSQRVPSSINYVIHAYISMIIINLGISIIVFHYNPQIYYLQGLEKSSK